MWSAESDPVMIHGVYVSVIVAHIINDGIINK